MKKALFLALLVFCCQALLASPQSRLVVRASRDVAQIADSFKIGTAAWSIIPNLLSNDRRNVTVVGIRVHNSSLWIDLMAGRSANSQKESWLANIRSGLTHGRFQSYHEVQWIPGDQLLYWMAQVGWLIKVKETTVARLGLETENIHSQHALSELKIGPNIMVPLSDHLSLAGTWYFPKEGQSFFRAYTIVNL